jgi:hypothetical protein
MKKDRDHTAGMVATECLTVHSPIAGFPCSSKLNWLLFILKADYSPIAGFPCNLRDNKECQNEIE